MLSERAKGIKPSPTMAIDSKAKAMKSQGIDVVNFGVGEPDFDTPEHIKQYAIEAIKDGFTKYTAVGGIDPLKEVIIKKFKIDNNLDYSKEEIIVSCGAKHSLYNLAQALYERGDEVLIPSPYWVSYPDQVILQEATPVFIETKEENGFKITIDDLKRKITKKTKAILINSPSNPTGFIYDKKTLEAIAEICVANNIYVVSDEIYEKLVYDNLEHISIASLGKAIKDKTIIINGLSKSHAMTGWRIGYAAGPKEIVKAMTNIQSQSTSNPASISQKAGVAALDGPQDFIVSMRNEFRKRREFLVPALNSIQGVKCAMPQGAFYVFADISSFFGKRVKDKVINSSLDMALYLLEEAKVALVHGSAFGDDSYIRLSYATSMDNIKKGIERIKKALSELN